MKKISFFFFLFSISLATAFAQKETFDLITFTPPNGWEKEVMENVIGYSKVDNTKNSWCRISIYKSVESKANIDQDFESEWQDLIASTYNISESPRVNEVTKADGWQIKSGGGDFSFNNKNAMALLTTIAGYGKTFSIVFLANSEDYMPALEDLIASIDLIKPNSNNTSSDVNNSETNASQSPAFNGYSYSTSNFDDGWNAAIKEDWVEVSKGSTLVLLHFGITMTDEIRMDITNTCWNQLAAPKYNIENLYPTVYSVTKDFPYYFIQADATEKASGKTVFVSFRIIPKNGVAYCYEIITPTRNEFQQQFPTMDNIENMSGYNRFAIGKNDLIGTWQEGAGAFTQYYYVSSGNYAGMNITVSNLKYLFVNGSAYKTEVKAVNNNMYASEKETGSYTVSDWEVSTTDQNGKISNFSSWFEATKGGRILHLLNKKYSSEHYQLGKVK
jgi:hypothetical protein